MRRIIVATDNSRGGNRAIDTAAKLAKATRCELIILTVGGSISGAELRQLASAEGDLSRNFSRRPRATCSAAPRPVFSARALPPSNR